MSLSASPVSLYTRVSLQSFLLLWFPSPPLAVSNGKGTTQRLSVFVGHSPGVGYPGSRLISDKLLSPWRVSSSHQLDSLWLGSMYTIYNHVFTIKIFTILCTNVSTINKYTLDFHMIQFYVQLWSIKV